MYSDFGSRSAGLARVDAAFSGVVNSRRSTSFYLRSEPWTARTFLGRPIPTEAMALDFPFCVSW